MAKTSVRSAKGAPDSPPLSRDAIVSAALELIDLHGLEAFSLRGVAKRLGVYPTAVYWYVDNKERLLAEAVALAFEPAETPDSSADWRMGIRKLFYSWRAAIRRHPNIAPAVGSQLVLNTEVQFALVERILGDLNRAGFRGAGLVGAYNSVVASLVGFVAQEFASMPRENASTFEDNIKDRLCTINDQSYPILAENVANLANKSFILRWQNGAEAPMNESFDFYIDVLIGGLAAALAAQDAPAPIEGALRRR